MCNACPYRDAGYCGCFDAILNESDGGYEPVYECQNPSEAE